jgi:hypothetical protein
MDRASFEAADPYVDKLSESVDQFFASPESAKLKRTLSELAVAIGERYSVSFSCTLEVFDRDRERSLPLLNSGLACSPGGEPYRATGDSSPHKYIARGEMQIVPHDRCPCCWGVWDFKFTSHACRECGATLGREVRILLDTDVCPNCDEGRVSALEPVCRECGFRIEPRTVVWG